MDVWRKVWRKVWRPAWPKVSVFVYSSTETCVEA
jgi:hypothetical protein